MAVPGGQHFLKAEESKFAFIIVLPFETNPAQHNGANDGSGIVGPDMQPNLAGQAYQRLYHQVNASNISIFTFWFSSVYIHILYRSGDHPRLWRLRLQAMPALFGLSSIFVGSR